MIVNEDGYIEDNDLETLYTNYIDKNYDEHGDGDGDVLTVEEVNYE